MVARDVVMVSVELPEPVTDEGLKLAVACGGKVVALSATGPVNPFSALTDTEYEAFVPALTGWLDGEAEREKSAGGVLLTTSVTVVEWFRLPLVPVIVNV